MTGKTIFDLKQDRATITTSIRAIMEEYDKVEIPGEKKEEMAKLEAKFDEINGKILKEEKQLERERIIGEAGNAANNNISANTKDAEIKNAFMDYLKTGSAASYEVYAALQQSNPTQAGYLVAPEKFVGELIKELDNSIFIRQISNVLPTLVGAQSLGYPKRSARMNRAVWGTEIGAPTPDTTLSFGKREFKPRPATAEILVSKTLIKNAPGTDGIVRAEMAFAFNELLEMAYLTGDGADKPMGIFTASSDGISTARDVSTGSATAITADGLIDAKYAIKEQYQSNLSWIFHRDGVKQIAKLKDNDNQYIWQPSLQAGQPDRLLGKSLYMSEYAPNTFTSGLYVGMLGDFRRGYWIVDSDALEIQALSELYARTNQIDYIGRLSTDGMPVIDECFARVKLA